MDPDDLDRLDELHRRGVLSDEEFQAASRRLMAEQLTGPLPLGRDATRAPWPTEVGFANAGDSGGVPTDQTPQAESGTAEPGWTPQGSDPGPVSPDLKSPGHRRASTLGVAAALVGVALLALASYMVWQRHTGAALARSGDAAFLAGDFDRAVVDYSRARERWSGAPILPERLAFAQGGVAEAQGERALAAKDYDQAVTDLGQAVQHYQAAEDLYRTAGTGDATDRGRLATRLTTARASEYFARGLRALRDGELEAAVEYLDIAHSIQPRPEIEAALGRARGRLAFEEGRRLLAAGDIVGAYEKFRAAASFENLPEYAAALRQVAEQLTGQAQSALDDGLAALRRGDFARAAALLATIPSAASEAFSAAQGPLAEARAKLAETFGPRLSPGAGPGATEPTAPTITGSAEVAALYAVHYLTASRACQGAIEAAAAGEVEWTDGWLERKFPDFEVVPGAPGVLRLGGQSLRIRQPDGTWRPTGYSCDFDTTSGVVVGTVLP